MTNYELQQLAVEWLRDFARKNDATAEGKHAARVLRLVDRVMEARAEGFADAIERAAQYADGRGAVSRHVIAAAIRALSPPAAEPGKTRAEAEAWLLAGEQPTGVLAWDRAVPVPQVRAEPGGKCATCDGGQTVAVPYGAVEPCPDCGGKGTRT